MNYAEYREQVLGEHGAAARQHRHDEEDLQVTVVAFFAAAFPADAAFWHVPNGGKRQDAWTRRQTRLGVRAGIADIHILHQGRLYCIELKSKTGQLSAVQMQMAGKFMRCGAPTVVCRTPEEARDAVLAWGIPLDPRVKLS